MLIPTQFSKSGVHMQYTFDSMQNRVKIIFRFIVVGSAPFETTLSSSGVLSSVDTYRVSSTVRNSDTNDVVINVVTRFALTAYSDGSFVAAMR